jgi:MFS transporter, ceroid-lipofuscinosis neuronal protein 7
MASPPNENDSHHLILLIPQSLVIFIDSISFMVVAPSLVFYVRQMGGSKEQYGIILSVFSFASFLFKPILGYWCDESGGKFRRPYLSSIAVAAMGGIVYFLASACAGFPALALIFVGRFLGGIGAANSTLGFTYIASVTPHDQMTKANAMLSMVRIFGMAAAPGFNVFLSKVHGQLFSLPITPLNSIGLVLFVANVLSFLVIYFLLKEPPAQSPSDTPSEAKDAAFGRSWTFWESVFSVEILVPIASILCLNANFQLLETGLAPASSHALHWGPVEISTLFGLNAIWIFLVILLSFWLSSIGVTDAKMLIIGSVASITGYFLMYQLWIMDTSKVLFILPIIISTLAFPFMGAPTRSLFTKVVAGNECLRNHQGTMQAVLSMAASVAGFAAPGLIAAFVLKTPEQVEASPDHRELTPYALFAPISSLLVLCGVVYMCWCAPVESEKGNIGDLSSDMEIGERTSLLSPSGVPQSPMRTSVRRYSDTIMSIPNITVDELRTYRNSVASQ